MSEDLGETIQGMFRSIYEAVDKKYLRPLKREMFKCGTTCLDDKNSIKESEKCINNCSRHINKAMGIIQKEVNAFQGRIDRCLMDCQDGVRRVKDEDEAKKQFDKCARKCIEKCAPDVPDVSKAIAEQLDRVKTEASA